MTDVMTETTMQGEKKKKIDEKQTRDRKNMITILLMLAIATTGTCKFVCKQDQSRRVRRSRFHRRGVRFHRLFRVLHDRAVGMYSKRKCEEITDSKAVENKWI